MPENAPTWAVNLVSVTPAQDDTDSAAALLTQLETESSVSKTLDVH